VLGKSADYAHYSALAQKIRNAINARYLNRQTNLYGTGVQTKLSMPLYWRVMRHSSAQLHGYDDAAAYCQAVRI